MALEVPGQLDGLRGAVGGRRACRVSEPVECAISSLSRPMPPRGRAGTHHLEGSLGASNGELTMGDEEVSSWRSSGLMEVRQNGMLGVDNAKSRGPEDCRNSLLLIGQPHRAHRNLCEHWAHEPTIISDHKSWRKNKTVQPGCFKLILFVTNTTYEARISAVLSPNWSKTA